MFMGKDIYLFEKVVFKGFKESIVIKIHGQEKLHYFELMLYFLTILRSVNAEMEDIYYMNRKMNF